MHYFIFPQQDAYISEESPSDIILYRDELKKNYGSDEILELKKDFIYPESTDAFTVSRFLIQFDYSAISQSIVDNDIPSDAKYHIKLYEVEGQTESNKEYTVSAYAVSQSWTEGGGKKYDWPAEIEHGVSWINNQSGSSWDIAVSPLTFGGYFSEFDEASQSFGTETSHGWVSSGSRDSQGGGSWIPAYKSSQSFNCESSDIYMDVTNTVNAHLNNSIPNYGFLFKFSGSYEGDSNRCNLKFFSRNTHTIYAPKLEIKWDDHTPVTGSNTGSLSALNMTGEIKNHIFIRGLKPKYTETERVRFRIGCRKKYVQKTFTESVHNSDFYIPEGRGFYSIVDSATNSTIVPFGDYSKLSCDTISPYFEQDLNTFEPGRYYKILFRLDYDDGQEIIIDNDDEFKVV